MGRRKQIASQDQGHQDLLHIEDSVAKHLLISNAQPTKKEGNASLSNSYTRSDDR